MRPPAPELRVWARTDHDLILVKPAGMACELTSDPRGVSLIARAQALVGGAPHLCHRLDRVTRGFVVVALDREAARAHGVVLSAHRWRKLYLARVRSPGRSILGPHQAWLRERAHRVEAVRSGGLVSRLVVLGQAPAPGRPGEDHVVVQLLTGRRHQVRVMLAALGAPLVGDPLYAPGVPGPFYLEHARLDLPDPWSGEVRVCFDPEDPDRERVVPDLMGVLGG